MQSGSGETACSAGIRSGRKASISAGRTWICCVPSMLTSRYSQPRAVCPFASAWYPSTLRALKAFRARA